jgi:hypothetical protein
LFDGVDDLIKRVADTENPEIRKIRAKVHASMVVARSASRTRALERAVRWHLSAGTWTSIWAGTPIGRSASPCW